MCPSSVGSVNPTVNTFSRREFSMPESSVNQGWVVKVGPVSGDIYMSGLMTVSSNYTKIVRIDSSYNVKFTTAYSGSLSIEACEVDIAESKIYILFRPSSGFTMGIFNATDGTKLQIYTSTQLSSVSINSALILESSNTMAILNVKDASGNLSICQFNFSNQQINCIKIAGTATPACIGVISNPNDLFYTAIISPALIFQRTNFITATPSYTYKISGSGTSYPYSSCVVDSDSSQIHTIHSFAPTSLTAPIFLSLNLTDGSAISQLYNFSMPCSATYHMEMKDTSLYATGYCSSLLTIFDFDTTTSTFSFYRYQSSSLVPYYLVVDPNSDRLINFGFDHVSMQFWYLAKIPRYQIIVNPDVVISANTSASRSASSFYTSTTSPTISTVSSISLTSVSLTSTTSTFTVEPTKSLDSAASYNLSPYSNKALNSNTTYSIQLILTCTVSGTNSIIYTLASCSGSSPPLWVTLDSSNGLLNFTTPCLTTQATYTFCVSSQVTGDSSAGLKQISLTVLPVTPCSIQNCNSCVSCDSTKCMTCGSGYALSSDSLLCILIPTGTTTTQSSTENTTSQFSLGTTTQQISTLSSIGITVGISAALSTLNVSSIIIVWMIFNQMRILILMLLTEAYFSSPVNNYLVGLKLFSFNFSFMFIQNIPWLKNGLSIFDFSQPAAVFQDIGLVSQSSLINNINLLLILVLVVLSHIAIRIIFKLAIWLCLQTKFKKISDFLNKVIKTFEFAVYIRLVIESSQFVLISAFSELKSFSTQSSYKIESLCISFIFALVVLVFSIFVFLLWIKKAKQETLNLNESWFGEVFKNIKNSFCTRSNSFILITRTVLLTTFLIFTNNYQDNFTNLATSKVYYLFFVQLVYTVTMLIMRPLEKAEANLILLVNESSFLTLCCLLLYFNIESRWNSTVVNVFQYIVTLNSMVVALISITIGTVKLCMIAKKNCCKKNVIEIKPIPQNSSINFKQPEITKIIREETKYEEEPFDSVIFERPNTTENSGISNIISKSRNKRNYMDNCKYMPKGDPQIVVQPLSYDIYHSNFIHKE